MSISSYESHGDYSQDSRVLEDPTSDLYRGQSKLPRLPVPTLDETLNRFLPTALPFCKDERERSSLHQAVRDFPTQAAVLQQRLEQRAAENSSWLQQWWNIAGYMEPRCSNVIHVSYFFRLPSRTVGSMEERGASALQTVARFALENLPADTLPQRNGEAIPLCSAQYKYLLSSCRIPRPTRDSYRIYANKEPPLFTTVAFRGNFFHVPVTDEAGTVLSRDTLCRLLHDVTNQTVTDVPQFGWLTGTNRDDWALRYNHLVAHFHKDMEELQSSLVLLCLDDECNAQDTSATARRLWHGDVTHSANRWFDKSIQIVVSDQPGHVGFIGEHTMADGMPTLGLCKALGQESDFSGSMQIPVAPKLLFKEAFSYLSVSKREELRVAVHIAKKELTQNIDNHEMNVLEFKDFGSDKIKQSGFSPDAFVQMAFQLASRNCFGETVGTYESSHTRRFLHGRTETTRSVSIQSVNFCNVMNDPSSPFDAQLEALNQALDSHVTYIRNAVLGRGVDRHFFGLQMSFKHGETVPDLLKHPVFENSKLWTLSTSTLPNTRPGFGNVDPQGVGIGYDILKDECVFTLASLKETGHATRMRQELQEALTTMKRFLSPEKQQSKL